MQNETIELAEKVIVKAFLICNHFLHGHLCSELETLAGCFSVLVDHYFKVSIDAFTNCEFQRLTNN